MTSTQRDLAQLSLDILRALRGSRSQTAINRKLGFKSNQLHRWESGQRKIPWSQFVRICTARSVPIERILLNALFFVQPADRADLLCQQMIAGMSRKDAARAAGIGYHSIRRWQIGESEPNLEEVFGLIALIPERLERFVVRLTATIGVEVPKSLGRRPIDAAAVLFQFQIAGALTAVLELKTYKELREHSSQWLADQLGAATAEIDECLGALEKAGLVTRAGPNALYRLIDLVIDTSGADPRSRIQLRAYWYERFVAAIVSDNLKIGGRSRLSYLLHALSPEAYEQITERLRLFYNDVDFIVRADEAREKDRVFYLGIDFVDLKECRR